ncbi:ANKRD50 [Symbiodinium microadriaticum]|nr:ANKRD50 [Symbiodinium microadriaticum]
MSPPPADAEEIPNQGDMAAVPTSDTLARDLAQLPVAGIMKTSTTDGSVSSKVSASEDVEPLPCEPWSGRYREAPEAFASLLEVPSAKEAREPTLKHKVIVLPPSRRNALRSPSPENNSPLVRLTRLRSPEISPRLLRPMPLFAQTAPTRRSVGTRNHGTLSELGILHPRTGSPVRYEAPGVAYPRTSSRLGSDTRSDRLGGRTPVTPTVPALCPSRIPSSWMNNKPSVTPLSGPGPGTGRPSRHSVGSCAGRPRSATPPFGRSCSQDRQRRGSENRQPLNSNRSASKGLKKSRGARAQSPEETAEPMTVLRRVEFTTDEAGRTDLMHAARDGDLVRASTLLCAGLPVDATDSCKCTALMYATTYGHVALARLLIEQGANVNALSHDRWTPLIAAVYNGHLPVAKYLLSKGANIECADDRGWTALMHVAFNGKIDILQCLLEHHADTERKDNEGRTALVYAAFSGHLQSVRLLLAATKRSDGADGPCSLALMFAADKGHMEVARTILDATFVSVRARASALELANLHGHHEVALHSVEFQNWNCIWNADMQRSARAWLADDQRMVKGKSSSMTDGLRETHLTSESPPADGSALSSNMLQNVKGHQVSQIQNISCLCAHSSRVCYFAEAAMPPVPNDSEDTLLQAYTALKNAVALDSSLQQKGMAMGDTRQASSALAMTAHAPSNQVE